MSYARSEPLASTLDRRQKQYIYSYQDPYLKTMVSITAQTKPLDSVADRYTPISNSLPDMSPRHNIPGNASYRIVTH
jgi:hypothetical protein